MFIRQLEAFRATMLAGTVSGAAELMGVSQPAVSRLLSRLENQLKLTLFDRTRGRLAPTREARILFEEVERTFLSADRIREVACKIQNAVVGHLHIAALPAVGLGFMPAIVEEFRRSHPQISVTLDVSLSASVEATVAAQNVDIGIGEFPFQRTGLTTEMFCRVPKYLIVAQGHPLAKSKYVKPADLVDAPFICLTRSSIGRHMIDRVFQKAGVTRRLVVETPFHSVACDLVSRNAGVALVNPFTAADYSAQGIVAIPFRPKVEFRLAILYPTHRLLSRVAREFLVLLRRRRDEFVRASARG
jgi:DNA-binding transcriptional LysR family regulator